METSATRLTIAKQFLKYGVVGLVSNGVLYLAYLGLTHLGLGPKVAMTITYCTGTVLTFVFNRRWTFRSREKVDRSFYKYAFTYAMGYVVNYLVLLLLVDTLALPHRIVQGVMILVIAVGIFLSQKYWVFKA